MFVRHVDKGISQERLGGFLSSRFVIRYSIFYFRVSLLIFCFISELLPIRTKTRGFWCLAGMRTKAYLENGCTDFDVLGRSRFVIRYSNFYLCVSILIFSVVSELFPIRTNPDQIRTKSGQTRTNPTCLIEPFQTVYYSEYVCRFWCFPPEMNYANVKSCFNCPTIIQCMYNTYL